MSNSIGERIGLIIDSCNVKKVHFAERIGVHQTYVSQMVSDKKVPSDRVIRDICEEFNVNEHWLRTGEGDMFLPKSTSSLPAELAQSPMVRAILETYLDLDPQGRALFDRFFADVVARYKGEQPAVPEPSAAELARAAASIPLPDKAESS